MIPSRPRYGALLGTADKDGRVTLSEEFEKFFDDLAEAADMDIAENVAILKSAAHVATGTGAAVDKLGNYGAVEFMLDVTAAAVGAGDTLDVFIQTTLDGGANWIDVAHFTQVLGNGGAKQFAAKIARDQAEAMFDLSAALAAGAVRNLLGDQYRARWAIVGGTASFTFDVSANAIP